MNDEKENTQNEGEETADFETKEFIDGIAEL